MRSSPSLDRASRPHFLYRLLCHWQEDLQFTLRPDQARKGRGTEKEGRGKASVCQVGVYPHPWRLDLWRDLPGPGSVLLLPLQGRTRGGGRQFCLLQSLQPKEDFLHVGKIPDPRSQRFWTCAFVYLREAPICRGHLGFPPS